MFKKKSLSTAELIESRRKMLRAQHQEPSRRAAGEQPAADPQPAVASRRNEPRSAKPAKGAEQAEWIETEWFETRIDDTSAA